MTTISFRPNESDAKVLPSIPTNPLSFQQYQETIKALGKQYDFTLLDARPEAPKLVEYKVVDGHRKVFYVQNLADVWQCSCKEFVETQTDHCEHIGILKHAQAFPWVAQFRVFQKFERAIQQRKLSPLYRTTAFKLKGYSGESDGICTYTTGTKQALKTAPVIESVAIPTFRERFNLDSMVTDSELLASVPSSAGILAAPLNLYDYQEEIFASMLKAKKAVCSMTMGSGKAQPLSSKILTPSGWVPMGQIKVGDFVIGRNGLPTKVTGVYPQGMKEVFEVSFSDGSRTQCCEDHLWSVITPRDKHRGKGFKTVALKDIKDQLVGENGNHNFQVPMVCSVEFTPTPTVLDPYLLGVLLGVGSFGPKSVTFSSADQFVVDSIKAALPSNLSVKFLGRCDYRISKVEKTRAANELLDQLRVLGLGGKKSHEKFVPKSFLYNSAECRLNILQGLMDTDGFVSSDGMSVQFYSTSRQLAEDVQELVRSFGGKATLSPKQTSFTYLGVKKMGKPSYVVTISAPPGLNLFRLPRKLSRIRERTKYQPIRSMTSAVSVGHEVVQCISVDAADHLYVTDDYIVTHNTLTSIACCGWLRANLNPNARLLVICPKSLKIQWAKEVKRALGMDSLLVNTPKHLEKLGTKSVEIVTYQTFAKRHERFTEQRYDLVIMDEIQFIRNDESKAWKAAKTLKSEYFFGLSGTVIENRLDDLYSIMDVIAPGSLGPKWKFCAQFQNVISVNRKVLVFAGIKNIEQLHQKIKGRVFGYDKLTLPPITHTHKSVGMTPQQRKVHDDFHQMAKRLLAKALASGLSFAEKMMLQAYLLKARQACNAVDLITKATSPLSSKTANVLKDVKDLIAKGHKIVLFSQWTEYLDLLSRELTNDGIKHVFFTGRESEKQRAKSVEAFTVDPRVSVFLASDAGGVGLDGLQMAADVVIHTELPWNPARLDQRTGRVHRLGQSKPVQALYYYAAGTIEEDMLQVLQGKRDIRTLTLDVPKD